MGRPARPDLEKISFGPSGHIRRVVAQLDDRGVFRPLYFSFSRTKRRVVDPSENVTPTNRFRDPMGCHFRRQTLLQNGLQCLVFGS